MLGQIIRMGQNKLVAYGSIAAGDNKLDCTSDNAFIEFGMDLTSYHGNHKIAVTDSASKSATGYIHSVAPGGETLGAAIGNNMDFAAWTGDNPNGWNVTGESGGNEISEVGSGESHGGAGTGSLNIYTTGADINIYQGGLSVIGGVMKSVLSISAVASGSVKITNGLNAYFTHSTTGDKTNYYTGQYASPTYIQRASIGATNDITIDGWVLKRVTDCAATGALIVSTLGGSTRSWTSVDSGFNPNLACTYKIYRVR